MALSADDSILYTVPYLFKSFIIKHSIIVGIIVCINLKPFFNREVIVDKFMI